MRYHFLVPPYKTFVYVYMTISFEQIFPWQLARLKSFSFGARLSVAKGQQIDACCPKALGSEILNRRTHSRTCAASQSSETESPPSLEDHDCRGHRNR